MECGNFIFQAWKVMKFKCGPWKFVVMMLIKKYENKLFFFFMKKSNGKTYPK